MGELLAESPAGGPLTQGRGGRIGGRTSAAEFGQSVGWIGGFGAGQTCGTLVAALIGLAAIATAAPLAPEPRR